MKRRLVAVTLSLIMTMATVSEAGAAAFTSPDTAPAVATQTDAEEVNVTEETSETEADAFSDGDDGTAVPSQEQTDDAFTAGTDTAAALPDETPSTADATDAVGAAVVKAEDWVSTENGFKLRKPAKNQDTANTDDQKAATAALPDEEMLSETDGFSGDQTESSETAVAETDTTAVTAEVTAMETPAATDTVSVTNEEFYTVADGIVKISTEYKGETHTGYYLFDEEGILVTGQAEVKEKSSADEEPTSDAAQSAGEDATGEETEAQANQSYFTTADEAVVYTGCEGEAITPYTSTVGQQEKSVWKWTGTYFQYYDENGNLETIAQLEAKAKAAGTYTGYFKINEDYYCLDSEGKPQTGEITLTVNGESNLYYFDPASSDIPGKMFHNGWLRSDTTKGERWLYFKKGNIPADIGKYYKRGVVATAIPEKGGDHYYYFGSTPGRVVEKHGWQKLVSTSGKFLGWLYFDSKGNHYTDKWTSAGYYFKPSGKLASGLTEIDGKKYIFESSTSAEHKGKVYKSTMVRYKKKWYIASSKGSLYKSGWRKYSGNYYYLKECVVQTNQFMKKNGVNGYLDANGKYTRGWVIVSNAKNLVRYIDPSGNGFARNKSMRVNGILYYFDRNGYRITDLTNRYRGPYSVQVDRVNGVMTVYADSARTIPVKTIRVSVGLAGTPTPTGNFTLSRSLRWQPLMGPSWGQYGTHVDGAGQGGIFVHSVACGQANSYNLPAVEYNKLGSPASHGCIRTCVADAKWVYENCNGAPISIIDGKYKADDAMKGPLGKKALTPLRGAANFDPTDPAV